MACTSKTKPSFVVLDAAGEAVGVDICEVLLCQRMLKIVILNLLIVRAVHGGSLSLARNRCCTAAPLALASPLLPAPLMLLRLS
jgi:hypothetical protein